MRTAAARVLMLILLAAPVAPAGAQAQGEPPVASAAATPTPTPTPSDPELLALPALDLARVGPVASSGAPIPQGALRVGDPVVLRATGIPVSSPAAAGSLTVTLPKGNSPLGEQGWEVHSPVSRAGKASGEADLELTAVPLKPGNLTLPVLQIGIGDQPIARTNPWAAQVESAIPKDDPKPREPVPPRPPAELAFPWWVLAVAGALALAALALGGTLLYRWIRERRRAARAPRPVPPRTADQEALDALSALEKKPAVRPAELKAHYHAVSEVLKRYLGRRYDFAASESTTEELLATLERLWNDPAVGRSGGTGELRGLFERLDRVKFTDQLPDEGEPQAMVEAARKLVLATRPRSAPESLLPAELAAGTSGLSTKAGG